MEMGMGVLGWTPREFWRATFPELIAAYAGHRRNQNENVGRIMAAIYEQNRNPEKRAEPFTEYTFFPDLNPRKQMEDEPHELTPEEEDAEVDAMIAIMKGQR